MKCSCRRVPSTTLTAQRLVRALLLAGFIVLSLFLSPRQAVGGDDHTIAGKFADGGSIIYPLAEWAGTSLIVDSAIEASTNGSNGRFDVGAVKGAVLPPTASPQTFIGSQDNPPLDLCITLTGTDPEGGTLTARIVTLPALGSLYQTADGYTRGPPIASGGITVTSAQLQVLFAPLTGGTGSPYDTFGFVVNNGLDSAPQTVAVNVLPYQPLSIRLLAGQTGAAGGTDGISSGARFTTPTAVALDSAGNVYVSDSPNDTIRKITPNGRVTTLAGSAGSVGLVNGSGGAARFAYPGGLAVDSSGAVYVADVQNHALRKITSAGDVTTVSTSFTAPYAAAVDSAGTVYVTDYGVGVVYTVAPGGTVSTLASGLNGPAGITVDGAGNVFVSLRLDNTICRISPAGVVSSLAGSSGLSGSTDGTGSAARFAAPVHLGLDTAGNVYVADSGNSVVRKITPSGVVTTVAGLAGNPGSVDGTGAAARLNYPWGLALDSADNVYLADTGNDTVRTSAPYPPPPVASPQTLTIDQDTSVTITLSGTDPEGGSLTAKIVTLPASGTLYDTLDGVTPLFAVTAVPMPVIGSAMQVIFTPAPGQYASPYATFGFAVNAGGLDSAAATVTVNVSHVNHPPVALAQSVTATAGQALAITLSGTDPDGDTLTFSLVSLPLHGTLSGSGPAVTYTSVLQYLGPDTFTFQVSDGLLTDTAAVSVTAAAGAPAQFAFFQQPLPCAAGARFKQAVTVRVEDQYGNLTTADTAVNLAVVGAKTGGGRLSGATTAAAASGVAVFWGVSISSAGTGYTLSASAPGVKTAVSSAFDVLSAATLRVGAWGQDVYHQTDVPDTLSGVVDCAAGYAHTVALTSGGKVVCWGDDSYSQCDVPDNLPQVVAVAAGAYHTLALCADGGVRGWGLNQDGQAGGAPNGLTGVVALAGGANHTLALLADGTVRAWGADTFGQTDIPDALAGVTGIAAGGSHNVALKSDGTIICWGDDSYGQCEPPDGLPACVAVAAGAEHTAALRSDGTLAVWGSDYENQITSLPSNPPPVVTLSAGGYHTAALCAAGTVLAWGADYYGECDVPQDLTSAIAVTANGWHTAAIYQSVPAQITISAGDQQTGTVNAPLAIPPAVLVTDVFGIPISGVAVSFSVTGGAGSVSGTAALTGATGIAAAGSWTLGNTVGPNTLKAAAAVLPGQSVTFTAIAAGTEFSVKTSTILAAPAALPADGASQATITVTLKDALGNPLASGGDTVALSATAGKLSAVTDNHNGAYSATLTAAATPAQAVISATVDGTLLANTASVQFVSGGGSGTIAVNSPPAFAGPAAAGLPLQFSIGASSLSGNNLTYTWDFGDGGSAGGANPSHTYANAGTYTVTVTITDGQGGVSVQQLTVQVGQTVWSSYHLLGLLVQQNFGTPNSDTIRVSVRLPALPQFTPGGKTVTVNFIGLVKQFTLSASGKAQSGGQSCVLGKYNKKTASTTLKAVLTHQDLAAVLDGQDLPYVTATLLVTVDGVSYAGQIKTLSYRKRGHFGITTYGQ